MNLGPVLVNRSRLESWEKTESDAFDNSSACATSPPLLNTLFHRLSLMGIWSRKKIAVTTAVNNLGMLAKTNNLQRMHMWTAALLWHSEFWSEHRFHWRLLIRFVLVSLILHRDCASKTLHKQSRSRGSVHSSLRLAR
jgi:hypothetical protein